MPQSISRTSCRSQKRYDKSNVLTLILNPLPIRKKGKENLKDMKQYYTIIRKY